MWFEILLKRHIVPDLVVRFFIWVHFVIRRLKEPRNIEMRQDKLQKFIKDLKQSPIALETDIPNDQHYEVPSEFFKYIMGEHMKYSCCLFNEGRRGKRNWAKHLDKAEEKMLALTVKRAGIKDGMDILDCGCGWGSLALYAAEKFPNSQIVAISNSSTQKDYIIKIAGEKNLKNIEVITCDIKHFEIERKFDVITSIEMFEHMRNYEKLMEKLAGFLKPDGKLFVHVFAYRGFPYLFKVKKSSGFITKYFFMHGIMPSDDLLLYFQKDLSMEKSWRVNGRHYYKTCMAWYKRMRMHKDEIMPILAHTYGDGQKNTWWNYWRIFFLSCAQMFHFRRGNRWFVAHYLFRKR